MRRLLGFGVTVLVGLFLISPVYGQRGERVDVNAKKGCGCGIDEVDCCCCKTAGCSARAVCRGSQTCTCSCRASNCKCSCDDDIVCIGGKLTKWETEMKRDIFDLKSWDDDYSGIDMSFVPKRDLRPFNNRPVVELLDAMVADEDYELMVTPQADIRAVRAPFKLKQAVPMAQKDGQVTFCTSRISVLVFAGHIAANTSCPVILKVWPDTLATKTVSGFFKGDSFEDIANKALGSSGLSVSRRSDGTWELGVASAPELD